VAERPARASACAQGRHADVPTRVQSRRKGRNTGREGGGGAGVRDQRRCNRRWRSPSGQPPREPRAPPGGQSGPEPAVRCMSSCPDVREIVLSEKHRQVGWSVDHGKDQLVAGRRRSKSKWLELLRLAWRADRRHRRLIAAEPLSAPQLGGRLHDTACVCSVLDRQGCSRAIRNSLSMELTAIARLLVSYYHTRNGLDT